jgi:uncharacterized membrane protein
MSEPYGDQQRAPMPYGQPYYPQPIEHPQGTTVLVLGILGFFVAGVCAPFAWYLGNKALKEMRASGVRYSNEQSIVVGRILGIIMTVLLAVSLVILLAFVVILVITAVVAAPR